MLWFKRQPIVRGPSPEGPWPGKVARFPGYVLTGRTQSHSALPRETVRGLRGHSHDFQGVKFRRLQVRQDLLDCPAERLLFVKTENGRSDFTRQENVQPASWIFRPNP